MSAIFTVRVLCLLLVGLMPAQGGAGPSEGGRLTPGASQQAPPRHQLALAFVQRDSASLRRLLAPDLMVWPPPPDAARRGGAAIDYLLGLAAATRVTHSELRPRAVTNESGQTVEDGTWTFLYRDRLVMAKYDLRWTRSDDRWWVSFLKWETFR